MFPQKSGEVVGTDFFFTFDEESDVSGEFGVGFEVGFDGGEVREVLTFVVADSASVDAIASDGGFEGRGVPEVEGIGRLNVVVPINDVVRFAWAAAGGGDDDG